MHNLVSGVWREYSIFFQYLKKNRTFVDHQSESVSTSPFSGMYDKAITQPLCSLIRQVCTYSCTLFFQLMFECLSFLSRKALTFTQFSVILVASTRRRFLGYDHKSVVVYILINHYHHSLDHQKCQIWLLLNPVLNVNKVW